MTARVGVSIPEALANSVRNSVHDAPRVPPHDRTQHRIRLEERAVAPFSAVINQPFFRKDLQYPPKHGVISFHVHKRRVCDNVE